LRMGIRTVRVDLKGFPFHAHDGLIVQEFWTNRDALIVLLQGDASVVLFKAFAAAATGMTAVKEVVFGGEEASGKPRGKLHLPG
jgi:hypothetical protein